MCIVSSFFGSGYAGLGSSSETSGLGEHIIIKSTVDGETVYVIYAHLSSEQRDSNGNFNFKAKDTVEAGQQLGFVGNTGDSVGVTGIHLHFEVRDVNWNDLDPRGYLPETPTVDGINTANANHAGAIIYHPLPKDPKQPDRIRPSNPNVVNSSNSSTPASVSSVYSHNQYGSYQYRDFNSTVPKPKPKPIYTKNYGGYYYLYDKFA